MKKILILIIATLSLLTGCGSNKLSTQDMKKLYSTENGPRYIVTIKVKQSHLSLDIEKHIKDSMNSVEIAIPVDKEFYDDVEIGDSLNNDFRLGSLVTAGSVGSWDITISNKTILE